MLAAAYSRVVVLRGMSPSSETALSRTSAFTLCVPTVGASVVARSRPSLAPLRTRAMRSWYHSRASASVLHCSSYERLRHGG